MEIFSINPQNIITSVTIIKQGKSKDKRGGLRTFKYIVQYRGMIIAKLIVCRGWKVTSTLQNLTRSIYAII